MQLDALSPSSCFLSYSWDWGKKYSKPYQIYRLRRNFIPEGPGDSFDYGKEMVSAQNRVRGRGYSLSVKLEAEEGKDCKIAGLGVMYSMEQQP